MRQIRLTAISSALFAPFGVLVAAPPGTARVNFVAPVTNSRLHARANLAIVHPPVTDLPLQVDLMERHCFSTQAFLPINGVEAVLLVAPGGDDGPDLAAAQAFLVPGNIGFSYHIGVWHAGMILRGAAGAMAMLVHEDGSADDTEFRPVPTIEIQF
jgi:ureidoglycolate lyase